MMTIVRYMNRKTKFTMEPWVVGVKFDRRKSQSSSLVDTSIQSVTGGTDQTLGECSLGQTIPI